MPSRQHDVCADKLGVFPLCACRPAGYQVGGKSNGTSGGSAISAAGWRFNICQDPGRCKVEPADGISKWYRKMWQVRTWLPGVGCMVRAVAQSF